MKKEIFKYLNSVSSMEPKTVDSILISSFLTVNNISVLKNEFIKDYIITTNDKNEHKHLLEVVNIIQSSKNKFTFESLITLFEFVISPSDRVVNGAIYTPDYIRQYIIENTLNEANTVDERTKISDISCGCGSFLFDVARWLKKHKNTSYFEVFKNNIFGLDIQDYSITRAKLLLILLALSEGEDRKIFDFNLYVGNALDFKWSESIASFSGFDVVLGNPPYVCSRNISEDSKKLLHNWSVCSSGHPDLYIPFFQIGIENLCENGILGYITMNSFLKSINGRALREYFQQEQKVFKLIDFGSTQIFQNKSTYTCICLIKNSNSLFLEYSKSTKYLNQLEFTSTNYSVLDSHKGWSLDNKEFVDKIENTGKPFGTLYKTRNGIATLKNKVYIFDPKDEDEEFFYLDNGKTYKIEKGICKDVINPNKFTNTTSIEEIKKKIIFPYVFKENKVSLLSKEAFKKHYPNAYAYLSDQKEILQTRDKGNGKYEEWFAYGRNQSLEKLKNKLFFPHITPSTPNFTISTDENLIFYNGLAVVSDNKRELQFLKKLMSSRLFWKYILLTSKPYGSNYYSLSRNYIRSFGVYEFSESDKDFLINTSNQSKLDKFIEQKYSIKL